MSIDSIGGFPSAQDMMTLMNSQTGQSQAPVDRQTLGASVVSNTLDTLNGQGPSSLAAPMDKQTFGAAVVSKTLDYMNAGQGHDNGMAQSYNFQKDVLGGYAAGIGALANVKV